MQTLCFPHDLTKAKNNHDLGEKLLLLKGILGQMMQENVLIQSLHDVRINLLSLLANKDKHIKILLACCFAELLRLYAPEAPYDQPQLKALFALFFKQLSGLADPHGT
jgi:sister-chromatid-cohesion protein PDS5